MEFKVVLERLFARASAVLIESDWNLKTIYDENITPLESINRIRLEFKVIPYLNQNCPNWVLIESDWNLKNVDTGTPSFPSDVLIESDWNLKSICDALSL